ncbi:hypothetical protein [Klebsiella oxytoca]|uniref:hypothetical protein n=1 Tax=Klebsiella oxytoca TaxID=571 RepID=UPI003EE1877B
MQEFKGTPGPWVNVGGWVDAVKPGELSSIVCAISSVADRNPEYVNDANANLIAAAPDLLDALVRLKIEIVLSDVDMEYIESHFRPWLDKAKQAIDKALGK